jgi:hypothetical protein
VSESESVGERESGREIVSEGESEIELHSVTGG